MSARRLLHALVALALLLAFWSPAGAAPQMAYNGPGPAGAAGAAGPAGGVGPTPFYFAAATSVTNAAAQYMPPGSGASTSVADTLDLRIAQTSQVSTFAIAYTGNAANVGGQTLSYALLRTTSSAVTTTLSTIAGLTAAGGFAHSETSFAGVQLNPGDALDVTVTPSGILTGAVTNLSAGVSGVAAPAPSNLVATAGYSAIAIPEDVVFSTDTNTFTTVVAPSGAVSRTIVVAAGGSLLIVANASGMIGGGPTTQNQRILVTYPDASTHPGGGAPAFSRNPMTWYRSGLSAGTYTFAVQMLMNGGAAPTLTMATSSSLVANLDMMAWSTAN